MLLFQMRCMPCILLYLGLISPFVNLWDFSRTIRKDRGRKQIATLRREGFFFRASLTRNELAPEAKSKKQETISFLLSTNNRLTSDTRSYSELLTEKYKWLVIS